MHFFAFLTNVSHKFLLNKLGLFKYILTVFCQFLLVFNLIFGMSLPVRAQENGIIGFSECRFGSAEQVRKDNNAALGNETIRKCLQQILTFVFVLGIFLIGMRIGIEAFKSLNPSMQGNSIDNSVKLGKDVVIGLILIGAPSLFLGLFNEAALQLPNLFDLGKFANGAEVTKPKAGSGTGTKAGTGTKGGSGTTGAGGGAGIDLSPKTLIIDGKKITQKEIEDAQNAEKEFLKNRKPPLTPEHKKILEALKNQAQAPATGTKIYIKKDPSGNDIFLDKPTVEKAIADYKIAPVSGSQDDNREIVKSILTNCLTKPEGSDKTSCNLIKTVELSSAGLPLVYLNGTPLKLPSDYKITNGDIRSSNNGKTYITVLDNSVAKIEIRMTCTTAEIAKQSLLSQDNYSPNNAVNLNPIGCDSTITPKKLK